MPVLGKVKIYACCDGNCGDVVVGDISSLLPREIKEMVLSNPTQDYEMELLYLDVRPVPREDGEEDE